MSLLSSLMISTTVKETGVVASSDSKLTVKFSSLSYTSSSMITTAIQLLAPSGDLTGNCEESATELKSLSAAMLKDMKSNLTQKNVCMGKGGLGSTFVK